MGPLDTEICVREALTTVWLSSVARVMYESTTPTTAWKAMKNGK